MKYIFTGVVHPERASSGAIKDVKIATNEIANGKNLVVSVTVEYSTVFVIIEDSGTGLDIWTLKNAAQQIADSFVDAIGFENGVGYDVEIRSVVLPDDSVQVFGAGLDDLRSAIHPILVEFGITAADVALATVGSPQVSTALADIREGIRMPGDTGFYSFRAMEAIRQFFVDTAIPEDDRVKKSWVAMGQALNITQSYSEKLFEYSTERRHGGSASMTGAERVDFLVRAWTVVFRFIMLRKLAVAKLPIAKFRQLT